MIVSTSWRTRDNVVKRARLLFASTCLKACARKLVFCTKHEVPSCEEKSDKKLLPFPKRSSTFQMCSRQKDFAASCSLRELVSAVTACAKNST